MFIVTSTCYLQLIIRVMFHFCTLHFKQHDIHSNTLSSNIAHYITSHELCPSKSPLTWWWIPLTNGQWCRKRFHTKTLSLYVNICHDLTLLSWSKVMISGSVFYFVFYPSSLLAYSFRWIEGWAVGRDFEEPISLKTPWSFTLLHYMSLPMSQKIKSGASQVQTLRNPYHWNRWTDFLDLRFYGIA